MLTAHQLAALDHEPRAIAAKPAEPINIAAMRAIHYDINSSAAYLAPSARAALDVIAGRVGFLVSSAPGAQGRAEHWRHIAAAALQMEAVALGLDYTSLMNDKSLTPD